MLNQELNYFFKHTLREQNYINIEKIIELGDNTERAFFRWLNENNIAWYQKGSNLKNIWVFATEQCKQVKDKWNEVELNKA